MRAMSVADIRSVVTPVAKNYDVRRISLFGSYASGKRNRKSDIDFLVDFGGIVSIYKMAGLKLALQNATGKEVDIVPVPIPDNSFLKIDKEVVVYEE